MQVSFKCATAKYGLGLVCRKGKRLENAALNIQQVVGTPYRGGRRNNNDYVTNIIYYYFLRETTAMQSSTNILDNKNVQNFACSAATRRVK